ncbi:MAG: ATP-binding protein, partial [Bacteroidetes bacterium]|nr:ATP-binding protein [Bacteroidota bacterium]
DQGPGIALEDIPDPNLPENLLKPGGRGVFFMKQVMDEVRMERGPKGSALILSKARGRREIA